MTSGQRIEQHGAGEAAEQIASILSGAVFPVSTFPFTRRVLARVLPAYPGIIGLREALLTESGGREILSDMFVLVAFDIVLLPQSVALFSRSLAAARRIGTVSRF